MTTSPTLALYGALALLLAAALLAAPAQAQPLPQIPAASWSKRTHDYGEVGLGGNMEAVFKLTNVGGAMLRVMFIEGSSSHIQVIARPRRGIAPGETQLLTVRFKPRGAGPFREHLRVTTNEPGSPVWVLTLKGVHR